jgi:hypothetical protein
MNAILRRLTARRLSLAEMADILEKHIDAGSGDIACNEACAALREVLKHAPNHYLRAALRVLDAGGDPCARVRKVVKTLRKWRHASGA